MNNSSVLFPHNSCDSMSRSAGSPLARAPHAMKPTEHVRSSITDDGVVLLDIASGRIFSANVIGARIWRGLEGGEAVDAIVDRIAADTGAERAIVDRDAARFIEALEARGLVCGG